MFGGGRDAHSNDNDDEHSFQLPIFFRENEKFRRLTKNAIDAGFFFT